MRSQSRTAPIFQYSTTSRNGWNIDSYIGAVAHNALSVLNHESKRLEPYKQKIQELSDDLLSVLNHESKRLEPCGPAIWSASTHKPFSTQPRVETAGTDSPGSTEAHPPGLSVLNHESKRLEPGNHHRPTAGPLNFQYSTTSRNGWNPMASASRSSKLSALSVLNHESKRLEHSSSVPSSHNQPHFQYSTTSRNGWNVVP